jgi:hypothetical protein
MRQTTWGGGGGRPAGRIRMRRWITKCRRVEAADRQEGEKWTAGRQADRQARQAGGQAGGKACGQAGQAGRRTGRQADRQADRKAGRRTGRSGRFYPHQ